jgi:enterochelin esterase family protein
MKSRLKATDGRPFLPECCGKKNARHSLGDGGLPVKYQTLGIVMQEHTGKITSEHLGNERPIWVLEPETALPAKYLTVILDGELYRDRVGALGVINDLRGKITDSWFVFVSMGSVEARWLECPCYPPFADFIVTEVLPWLQIRYPAMESVQNRVLVGLSYTGLAAAFIAKEYPGVFQKVISQSGSFWSDNCWLTEQFKKMPQPVPTAFYLDVGTKETQENVLHRENVLQVVSQIEGVRRFRDVLVGQGYVVRYLEFDGGHEFEAWKKTLPGALAWALPV